MRKDKIKIGYNKHLTLNNLLILIRIVSVIVMVVTVITTIVFAVRSTGVISIINNTESNSLIYENKVIDYFITINHMSLKEAENLIVDVQNPLVLSIIYTVVPTLILFIVSALIFISSAYLFKFTAGIKSQKGLLNKERYNLLSISRVFTYIALVVLMLMFGISFFFILIIYALLFESLLYMYDSVIEVNKKDKK